MRNVKRNVPLSLVNWTELKQVRTKHSLSCFRIYPVLLTAVHTDTYEKSYCRLWNSLLKNGRWKILTWTDRVNYWSRKRGRSSVNILLRPIQPFYWSTDFVKKFHRRTYPTDIQSTVQALGNHSLPCNPPYYAERLGGWSLAPFVALSPSTICLFPSSFSHQPTPPDGL